MDGTSGGTRIFETFASDWAQADRAGLEQALVREPDLPAREKFFEALETRQRHKGEKAFEEWRQSLPYDLRLLMK